MLGSPTKPVTDFFLLSQGKGHEGQPTWIQEFGVSAK